MTPDTLEPLATTSQEIEELFARYAVALSDARLSAQSPDGRYVDAYTAGFLLAKIAVRASGLRVKGGENHLDTLRAVPWLMGGASQASIDALEAARKRRNATMYDAAGLVEAGDVERLLERVAGFEILLREWLTSTHAELLDAP